MLGWVKSDADDPELGENDFAEFIIPAQEQAFLISRMTAGIKLLEPHPV